MMRRSMRHLLATLLLLVALPAVGHADPVTPTNRRFAIEFTSLRVMREKGIISEAKLREEMKRNHVRHDAFEVLDRTPPLAA